MNRRGTKIGNRFTLYFILRLPPRRTCHMLTGSNLFGVVACLVARGLVNESAPFAPVGSDDWDHSNVISQIAFVSCLLVQMHGVARPHVAVLCESGL